jgi:hypothetical protein
VIQHGTIRASTLQTILDLIMREFNVNGDTALKLFYESHIGSRYADDDSGLYGQSALYVFSLYMQEQQEKARDAS